MQALAIGTKVRTTYVHSETGMIVKTSRTLPGPGWHAVRFDRDGARMCIHRDMLVIANG